MRTSEAKSSAQVFSVERPKAEGAASAVPRPKAAESLATAAAVSAKSHAVPHAIR